LSAYFASVFATFAFALTVSAAEKDAAYEAQKARAVKLVSAAVDAYKKDGNDAFAEITKKQGKLRDGDLYVFVYDLKGVMKAHGQFAGSIGNNFMKSRDQDGRYYVRERIEMMKDRDEAWQEYKYLDPATKAFRQKSSFLKKHDGLIFGCGVYSGDGK
jgi:signal transduction histidine kinase